jgi:hypothetical protein
VSVGCCLGQNFPQALTSQPSRTLQLSDIVLVAASLQVSELVSEVGTLWAMIEPALVASRNLVIGRPPLAVLRLG